MTALLSCDRNQMLRHQKFVLTLGALIHADFFWFLDTELYHAAGTGAKIQKFFQCLSLWEIYQRFSTERFTETHVKPNESYQRHLSLSMSCYDSITKWQGWAKPSQNLVKLSVYLCALLSAKEMKWDWDNCKYNLQETVGDGTTVLNYFRLKQTTQLSMPNSCN